MNNNNLINFQLQQLKDLEGMKNQSLQLELNENNKTAILPYTTTKNQELATQLADIERQNAEEIKRLQDSKNLQINAVRSNIADDIKTFKEQQISNVTSDHEVGYETVTSGVYDILKNLGYKKEV